MVGSFAFPSLFLGGMYAGEMLKAMVSTRLVSDTPVGATSVDEMKLEVLPEARLVSLDPGMIRMELARGWDRERVAFGDNTALIYFSGPFFEEHEGNSYYAHAIGDLYFDDHLEVATEISRPFADRRYYMALTRDGRVEFGFGGWRPGFEERYQAFVGGLGFLFNSEGEAATYSNPYTGLKQELHNMIPRERLIVGRSAEGRLVVIKTLPMLVSSATWFAKEHGLVEAYYLDQGNKARFIVPGQIEDAPRYNLPYLLRISDKTSPPLENSPVPLEEYQLHHKKPRPRPTRTPEASPSASPDEGGYDPFAPGPQASIEPVPEATEAPTDPPLPEETPLDDASTPDPEPTPDP